MLTRRFGRTGHESSIVIFGAFAVGQVSQPVADGVVELLLARGVNHIDVAPSYSDAELRLGPQLEKHRDRFFLGCKTFLRGRQEAHDELQRSLERLRVEQFDLYQLHAVNSMEELERCFAPGGSLEAILQARDEGLTRYVGITSHGFQAPAVQLAALERFDFDSLLFPLNAQMLSDPAYRRDFQELMQVAADRDVGTMVIKTLARRPWGEQPKRYHTWYEPHDEPAAVAQALHFALSPWPAGPGQGRQPVTGAISSGDARLLPLILDAADAFRPMDAAAQQAVLDRAGELGDIFAG